MGDSGSRSTLPEAERAEMYQPRDHTIISGFPALSPAPYSSTTRLTNALCSFKGKLIAASVVFVIVIVLWKTFAIPTSQPTWTAIPQGQFRPYQLQTSYQKYTADSTSYRVAIISDMDTASQIDNSLVYRAEVKEGRLSRIDGKYKIDWDHTVRMKHFIVSPNILSEA